MKLILASQSPRRRELLRQVGIGCTVDPSDVEECVLPGESPGRFAMRVALEKAQDTAKRHKTGIVLGADTIVLIDGEILGKPVSSSDAVSMLTRLSGRTHTVMTAVALVDAATGRNVVEAETTEVGMRELTRDEIEEYVATGEPMDKAGAYGIQGRAALFVESVSGCFFNVVGLPLARLSRMLKTFHLL